MSRFASRLIAWQKQHGRHDLPWQQHDPYYVWLSEIMLQQTQVGTVIPYFRRFTECFPTLAALAAASEDEVLRLWSGLGYYSRARNLHRAAILLTQNHSGVFPDTVAALQTLPGVGRSTAAAIVALAWGQRAAILDGNVRRVLARHAGIAGWPGDKATENALWAEAEARLPGSGCEPDPQSRPEPGYAAYTQALMDLGSLVCTRTRPACAACPVAADCVARSTDRVGELPGKRPRKILPERSAQLLLVQDSERRILLEQRPSPGLWGGLWSLPQLDADADPLAYCLARFGVAPESSETLPPLRHVFSHFRLDIQPRRLRLAHPAALTAAAPGLPAQCWLTRAAALASALPKPIRSLLESHLV